MIISHKYKYVFIQLDQTASTAIGEELIKNYCGENILWKHARYSDFMRIASPKEKKYFIFSGIRNPLDNVVSLYFLNKKGLRKHTKANQKMTEYIRENKASFEDFFIKFFSKQIYEDWKTKDFDKLNYVYRYENLDKDFAIILKKLKLKQKRPLPLLNKTPGKKDFIYYFSSNIQPRARTIFSMFMKRWGYNFPSNWIKESLYEKYIFGVILMMIYRIKKLVHVILDNPIVYRKIYKNNYGKIYE